MKLQEIYWDKSANVDIHLGGLKPNDVIWKSGARVSDSGGNPIYKYDTNVSGWFLFTLQQNDTQLNINDVNKEEVKNNIISLVVLASAKNKYGNFFMTKRVWTVPKSRRKGHMLNLIDALYRKLNYKMLSDNITTNMGVSFWKGVSQKFPVNVLNFDNGKRVPRDQVPDNIVYSDPHPSKGELKYLLVLEYDHSTIKKYQNMGIPIHSRNEPSNTEELIEKDLPFPYSLELLCEYKIFNEDDVKTMLWWGF